MTFETKVLEAADKWCREFCFTASGERAFTAGAAFAKKELEVCPLESWECKKIEKELRAQLAEKDAELKDSCEELHREIKRLRAENTRLEG